MQEVSGAFNRLTKNGFAGPKSFRGFRETEHWSRSFIHSVYFAFLKYL